MTDKEAELREAARRSRLAGQFAKASQLEAKADEINPSPFFHLIGIAGPRYTAQKLGKVGPVCSTHPIGSNPAAENQERK